MNILIIYQYYIFFIDIFYIHCSCDNNLSPGVVTNLITCHLAIIILSRLWNYLDVSTLPLRKKTFLGVQNCVTISL